MLSFKPPGVPDQHPPGTLGWNSRRKRLQYRRTLSPAALRRCTAVQSASLPSLPSPVDSALVKGRHRRCGFRISHDCRGRCGRGGGDSWQTRKTADLRVDPPPPFSPPQRSPARLSIPIGAWPAATPHAAITHHNLLTVSCCMPWAVNHSLSQGTSRGRNAPSHHRRNTSFLEFRCNLDNLCRPSPDRVLRRTRPAQHPPCLISFPIHTPVIPPVQVTRRPWRGRYISALHYYRGK